MECSVACQAACLGLLILVLMPLAELAGKAVAIVLAGLVIGSVALARRVREGR